MNSLLYFIYLSRILHEIILLIIFFKQNVGRKWDNNIVWLKKKQLYTSLDKNQEWKLGKA